MFWLIAELMNKSKRIFNIIVMEENQIQEERPVYIHQYPYRFVQPYPYTYKTFVKGRWVEKPLLPTLVKEFKAYPPEYYEQSIQSGKIKVNGNKVAPDYLLKNGDQIVHVSVRVEPPVLDLPIEIVDQSEDFVVISKPPSIIVHTGGGHHYNTIESLLKYEYKFNNLHVLHRLDKCTSGLLIFAKSKEKVGLFHEQSGKQIMKKMYYARVGGNFPWEEKELSAYIECVSHKDGIYRVVEEIVFQQKKEQKRKQKEETVNQNSFPQKQQIQKEDLLSKEVQKKKKGQNNNVHKEWKDSRTLFKKVWYDAESDSSLLQCYPITGRTHQIRVHLQFLGYPILNDVGYGGRFVGNKCIEQIKMKQTQQQNQEVEGLPKKKIKLNEQSRAEDWDYENKAWEIMLHSFKYKFGGQQFKTSVPYWFFKENIGFKKINI